MSIRQIKESVKFSKSSFFDGGRKSKLLSDYKLLLGAQERLQSIWASLQQADFKNSGVLDDNAICILWTKQKQNLQDLLQIQTQEDLWHLIDEDFDGFLDEDEQILIFSIVKERIQQLIADLSDIYEYNKQKQLIEVVRAIEADIMNHQQILRTRNHERELKNYEEQGQEKLQNFNDHWEQVFKDFQDEKEQNMADLEEWQDKEKDKLNKQMQKDVNFAKIKPKQRMRDLQVEERLYALSGRYTEAQNIRNELSIFENVESNRVMNRILQEMQKKRQQLANDHKKQIRQMQVKNETQHNKMKIQMETAASRLNKEVKHYYNDITKNQNQASKHAATYGKMTDEIRRTKQGQKLMMNFSRSVKNSSRPLTSSASEMQFSTASSRLCPPSRSVMTRQESQRKTFIQSVVEKQRPVSPLKGLKKKCTRFGIVLDTDRTSRPINIEPEKPLSSSLCNRTYKMLDRQISKPNILPSLSNLYDENLVLK